MSLYSEIKFGAAAALPVGAALLNVVDGVMSVRVEEEEMLLTLEFQGSILGAGVTVLNMGFAVDSGTGFAATSTLPLWGATLAAAETPVRFTQRLTLAKGEHKIALQAADVSSTGHTISGGVVDSRFAACRDSNSATLGQGVNSKVQLSL
jgi:hypothetical protein